MKVALVGVEHAGNLGAIARVMANFGCSGLLLIDPACSVDDEEARRRAKHAGDILDNARVGSWELLEDLLVVGTTAQQGTDYNLPRTPLLPSELEPAEDMVLLFGPEGAGLSNDEVLRCDQVVRIPTSEEYPTLNLSHAVAILLYELSRDEQGKRIKADFPASSAKERAVALGLVDDIVPRLELTRGMKEDTQRRLWKRILGRTTGREMAALLGFLRRVKERLK